ncbi:hypothetical protein JQS43_03100 [Natronosporangium hydrolyticum]|uniref:Mandelate racemase/muconate lactonizing enzyme C-terminal domain-containing protein n=1 Tax=Natronosporangium hydrolyticum TaxID=2811111 RepID=A0A895YH34_9ACTN|nr:enolase C-terminal domain-like protein [Natronosporangium hydrolyticum]QSB15365.1 hypothetical protein JQS43_03100 [Natronosporangium hydrolyticum]
MTITAVEARLFRYQGRVGRTWDGNLSVDNPGERHELVLRIETSDGHYGVAFAEDPMLVDGVRDRPWVLNELLAPALLGEGHEYRERIWGQLRRLQRLHRTAIGDRTLCLVDLALWDLAGREAGKPVYHLIGAARDRVPAYASSVVARLDDPAMATPAAFADLAQQCVERGFTAFKLHTWSPWDDAQRSIARDIAACQAVRERVGSEIELMLDPFHFYTRTQARNLGRALEELDFAWLEEPMDEDSTAAYVWLCDQLELPIAGPEVAEGKSGIRAEWIVRGACDLARVGPVDVGGITPMLKVVGLCEAFNMPLTFHLGGLASLHVIASMPQPGAHFEYGLLHPEVDYEATPPWLTAPPYQLSADGMIDLPTVPGLGWQVDWEYIEANTIDTVRVTADRT